MSEPIVKHSDIVAFAGEKVNLKRDDVSKYRKQVNHLRRRLAEYIKENPDYDLVKMLHSGSVAKGTALKTINDMDVAVYIQSSDEIDDDADLLNWLIEQLKAVYPNMHQEQFEQKQHCVTLSFRGSGLDVDVVPVLYEGDSENQGFLIVKDTGEKVLTSISLHLNFIRARKDAQPNHFAQVVRLLKWWLRQIKSQDESFRFKSFMVELICAHLIDNGLDMSNYHNALLEFFAYIITTELKNRISFTDYYDASQLSESTDCAIEIFDPVNPENNIAGNYTEHNRHRIVENVQDAFDALSEAHYATTKSRAVEMWRFVFGPSFRM